MNKPKGSQDIRKLENAVKPTQYGTEDVLEFASALPEMEPSIARERLAQFPKLAEVVSKTFEGVKDTASSTIDKNSTSLQATQNLNQSIVDALLEDHHRKDTSAHERSEIRVVVLEVAKMNDAKDAEHMTSNERVIDKVAKFGAYGLLLVGAFFGVKAYIGRK